jgi:hypothetical protein
MSKRMHVEEIIYEDGSVGYRNSPMISNDKTVDGQPVAVAGVNDLELTQPELNQKMRQSRLVKAEFVGDREVVIRPKTKRELKEEDDKARARREERRRKMM